MYPLDSLYVRDKKYNKRAVCIAYSIWPFSSFLPVEGDLPGRCGSTLSQRVAKSFVSESDVASTLPVPHPEQKWSNAARKSYLAGPKDQCRAFVGSTGSSLASKRKIYLSEKRKVMVKTTLAGRSKNSPIEKAVCDRRHIIIKKLCHRVITFTA